MAFISTEKAQEIIADRPRIRFTNLDILNKVAHEADDAKQLLRDAGFGVSGTGLLETVKEALAYIGESTGSTDDEAGASWPSEVVDAFASALALQMDREFVGEANPSELTPSTFAGCTLTAKTMPAQIKIDPALIEEPTQSWRDRAPLL